MQKTNIYVGVNGSGKSSQLGIIAKSARDRKIPVVAISMSLNDKFPRQKKSQHYHYMGVSQGRGLYNRAIEKAIIACNREINPVKVNSLLRILNYAGYEEAIGFSIKDFDWNFESILKSSSLLETVSNNDFERLYSLCLAYRRIHDDGNYENIHWVTKYSKFGTYTISDIESIYGEAPSGEILAELLLHKTKLRKLGVLKEISVFFRKKKFSDEFISTSMMSSGELSLIATAFFLNYAMTDDSVLLIDEPENSLHPEWQLNYLSRLKDLFPYTQFECHIATHSPMIISGAQKEEFTCIYKYDGDNFTLIKAKSTNIEDALIDQFGIVTPKNNALSERCIDLINEVIDSVITKDEALLKIDEFRSASYEDKQEEFLSGVIEVIREIK